MHCWLLFHRELSLDVPEAAEVMRFQQVAADNGIRLDVLNPRHFELIVDSREGWSRWEKVEALVPEAELQGLDAELRSLSQGLATYESQFDHLAELNGKLADDVVQQVLEPA